jgi:hypothetical protein
MESLPLNLTISDDFLILNLAMDKKLRSQSESKSSRCKLSIRKS